MKKKPFTPLSRSMPVMGGATIHYGAPKRISFEDRILLYYQTWHDSLPVGLVIGYIEPDANLSLAADIDVEPIVDSIERRRIEVNLEGRLMGRIDFFE